MNPKPHRSILLWPALALVCALVIPAPAQEPLSSDTPVAPTIPSSAAAVTAPLLLQDGAISQPQQTDLPAGGKAVFAFTVATAGEYMIRADVDAPAESANSFYVNIDAPPEDPVMIWDIDLTNGFEERIVSWRGTEGDATDAEFNPKVFTLSAGEHTLVLMGREPTRLQSVSLHPYHAPPAPAEGTLAQLQQRYADAETTYRRALGKLTDTPEGERRARELRQTLDAAHAEQFMAAVRIAEANPKSPTGFAALEWVLKIVRSYYLPAGPIALSLMERDYAAEPQIAGVLAPLTYYFPYPFPQTNAAYEAGLKLLHAVMALNADRSARGHATLGLAWLAKRKFEEAESRGEPEELDRIRSETESAFEAVVRDYGDCPNLRLVGAASATATLGGEAERELREIRHLSIGQPAPEIDAEDIDGGRMRLSEHRGKVVLLVFWASWCGPCMADVPHEKELVERFKGRPFVLLGVNGDETKSDATKAVTRNQIPWRSFWNGDEAASDTIAKAWNVRGWPTVYVIDHEGVIREKYLYGKHLDEPLEKLVTTAGQAH